MYLPLGFQVRFIPTVVGWVRNSEMMLLFLNTYFSSAPFVFLFSTLFETNFIFVFFMLLGMAQSQGWVKRYFKAFCKGFFVAVPVAVTFLDQVACVARVEGASMQVKTNMTSFSKAHAALFLQHQKLDFCKLSLSWKLKALKSALNSYFTLLNFFTRSSNTVILNQSRGE